MERLTFKKNGLYYPTKTGAVYVRPDDGSNACRLLQRVGKLEDLEEQIGCPFEVIAKAIKAGEVYIDSAYNCATAEIYRIDNKEFVNLSYVKNEHIDNEEYKDTWCFEFEEVFDDFYRNPDTFIVKTSDYKKTWFLKEDKSE